jgi:hypothetical protein
MVHAILDRELDLGASRAGDRQCRRKQRVDRRRRVEALERAVMERGG